MQPLIPLKMPSRFYREILSKNFNPLIKLYSIYSITNTAFDDDELGNELRMESSKKVREEVKRREPPPQGEGRGPNPNP